MNIFNLTAILAALTRNRKRQCPSCHRTQSVPKEKQQARVTCRHCGKRIPPPPRPRASGKRRR